MEPVEPHFVEVYELKQDKKNQYFKNIKYLSYEPYWYAKSVSSLFNNNIKDID